MTSLYILAQSKNMTRLSNLFHPEQFLVSAFDTSKLPSLTAFVTRDKAISQQDFVLLDVGRAENWSDAHIFSAVQNLRRFSNAKLIFLGEPCEAVTDLFGKLASVHHIEHLITDQPGTDVEAELNRCFSNAPKFHDKLQAIQGMMAQQAVKASRPLTIPQGLILRIAVAGTIPRCGVTTQTFAVWHALNSLGFHPAIQDTREHLLPSLLQFEAHTKQSEECVLVHDIPFCTAEQPQFNAYIMDYGTLTPYNITPFRQADLHLLVGCTKPWELTGFADAMRLLMPYGCQPLMLANGAAPRELSTLKKYFGEQIFLVPHCPDLWTPAVEVTKAYTQLLLPSLKELCGMRSAPTPDCEVEHDLV